MGGEDFIKVKVLWGGKIDFFFVVGNIFRFFVLDVLNFDSFVYVCSKDIFVDVGIDVKSRSRIIVCREGEFRLSGSKEVRGFGGVCSKRWWFGGWEYLRVVRENEIIF